ncbi:CDP-glucose 4,6-dehydratase [Cohnella thermotolerans]|uniref:CDP-glucose 4,6-dehydratase n=1 Tax=Cohnella thermotolerans TaxID=329858 RepID=UPI00042414B7|nr:CDP-glucose 4,6-dehydratase [Cohnella thermotolerans]
MIDADFWTGKRVFLTGHTGFKGSWLTLWLHMAGAEVRGYSLKPPTSPSLFDLAGLDQVTDTVLGDVRDGERLKEAMTAFNPDIVIHMAAQPLVRESYLDPAGTYSINVMGTVNLFEAVRGCSRCRAVVNVTTDKCYDNREWHYGYRENDTLGGYDPYSSSKACSELVTNAYRSSFFHPDRFSSHGVAIATARAGNVIGGGDWAKDRLVPDCIEALMNDRVIRIRNPHAIRPWQHVLEPLSGYLLLARRLYKSGTAFGGAWNFGPDDRDARPVEWIARRLIEKWGGHAAYRIDEGDHPHEAHYLKLDCSKAKAELGWRPRWQLGQALDRIVEWYKGFEEKRPARELCIQQIERFRADS